MVLGIAAILRPRARLRKPASGLERASFAEQGADLLGRHRRTEPKALDAIAAELDEGVALDLELDAFGDHAELERVSERDDGRDHGARSWIARDGIDERLVDLQVVDREVAQVAHRRIAGSEVVDRQAHAHLTQVVERRAGRTGGRHERALGDLEDQSARRHPAPEQGVLHGLDEGPVLDLAGRDVDRHAQLLIVPARELRAGRAQDPAADLAVIKLIDLDHELNPIAIGSSSELRPGDTAIALGNPFGQDFTMTTGIVSAIARTISSGFSSYSIPSVIQTDAAINPGNSGGPLLDLNGAVIGVNTQIVSETAQSSGVGFAVPVDLVKRVVPSLIETGEYVYPLMGISGNEVELTLRENVGLPAYLVGAYVTSVSPDGPADLAGIRGDSGTQFSGLNFDGDVIVSINSVRMESMDDLIGYLALNTSPGEEIIVGVFRDGVEIALPMTLGSRPTIT